MKARCIHSDVCLLLDEIDKDCYDTYTDGTPHDCECYLSSDFHNDREKVLDEYNDELLTKLVQELASTWRMRDAKLFSIIRKYRRVPIGAMKAELRQSKDGE